MIRTSAIPVFTGTLIEAHQRTLELRQPLLVPTAIFADDRGWSLMNQMQGILSATGQINVSLQYPGVVKAWHRHALQTDFWLCVRGDLKVGVHRPKGLRSNDVELDECAWSAVIGEHRPAVVLIPPGLWHGAATVGHEPASLLYYVTHAYNPERPDEERRPHNEPAWFEWGVVFR